MTKRKLLSKINARNSTQKREQKREERYEKLERARQAKSAKKTVQQQQIDQEEGEVETEQQEMDQAEQVEVTYDHAMDFDFQLENYVQMSLNLDIGDQQPPAWAATAEAGVQCAIQTMEVSTQTDWSIDAAGNSPCSSPRRDNILMALELLAKLQSFAVADLLSTDQIADFRATADQFRVHMLEHFRRHCSTSKFHHLVHHAPEFAENHGFWGLLSEQPVEKFHALFNDDLARKANSKDLHDILMFCARESAIRNAIFDANEL
ncbi:hypothetical protein niasHT_027102 [Heterodera trifolii]|uniref:Uncharacterized protein n=1 Tax=Heterodera trifolii TaxID=157864 RepID=A0ABD2JCR6_9BILA